MSTDPTIQTYRKALRTWAGGALVNAAAIGANIFCYLRAGDFLNLMIMAVSMYCFYLCIECWFYSRFKLAEYRALLERNGPR